MDKAQKNIQKTSFQRNYEQINLSELSQSNTNSRNVLNTTNNNTWSDDSNQLRQKRTSKQPKYCPWSDKGSCFIQGLIIGSLLAGLLLAIITALWLTGGRSKATSTTETSNSINTTSASSSVTTSPVTTSTVTVATTSTMTSTAVTVTSTSSTTTSTTTTVAPMCSTLIWNTTGVTVAGVSGISGILANQLNEPWNSFIDQTNDYLYIADSKNHRIQLWLPGAVNGTTVAGTGVQGSTADRLSLPRDVFVDSSKNLYVADSLNQRIQFFPNGNTMGTTISSGWPSPGELWGVQVVDGSIYACDKTKSVVWKNGSVVAGNLAAGSGLNQLNQPQGFTVDTSVAPGTIYVANTQQHIITRWAVNATTSTIAAGFSGSINNTPTTLAYPVAVKLDSYTNMFVVDNNNNRIQLFCRYPTINLTGRTIAGTGVSGSTPLTLKFPAGVALDASLNLYVSDTSNHRVQKFQRLQ